MPDRRDAFAVGIPGIGAAIAKQLASEGAAVVVNYSSSKDGADRVVRQIADKGGKAVAVHANVAKKADIAEFNAMLKTARERIEKLFREGKSEADVIAARPLRDLDAKWAASDEAAVAFTKMVYNSFKRS